MPKRLCVPAIIHIIHFAHLVATMREHRYFLLGERDVFYMREMLLVTLLHRGQQQEAVTVRSEERMRLGVQPQSFGRPLRVGLLALPRGAATGRYHRQVLHPRHPDDRDLRGVLADPAGRYQIVISEKIREEFTTRSARDIVITDAFFSLLSNPRICTYRGKIQLLIQRLG